MVQLPYLAEKKQIDELNRLNERGYFLIIKNSFAISEEKKNASRVPYLEQTVKTYYNFVDQFPKAATQKRRKEFLITQQNSSKIKSKWIK